MENKILIFFTIIIVIVAVCVVIFIPQSNGENSKLSEVENNTTNLNSAIDNVIEKSVPSCCSVENNIKNDNLLEDYTASSSCCSSDVYLNSESSCCSSGTTAISSCCQ